MIQRPPTRPDVRQQIGPLYGLPRDPILAQIMQALEAQKQQEQQKAQIMQALGFGQNMSQFGAIPHGAGVLALDNKAWVRPGGTPPGIQMLLENLLGVQQGGIHSERSAGGMGNFPSLNQPMQRPGPIMQQVSGDPQAEAREQQQMQQQQQMQRLMQMLGGGM